MRIVDLTHPIVDGLPVYFPWHPKTEWVQTASYEEHNCVVHRLSMGTHTGTHIDAPSHIFKGMHHIDSYDLSMWYSEAQLLDFTPRQPNQAITAEEMKRQEIKKGIGIIVRTGWDRFFGTADYYRTYPPISPEAGKVLIEQDVLYLAADTPFSMEIHRLFLSKGKPLITNLRNLEEVGQTVFKLIAAPLLLKDGDGAPARVFAIVE